MVFSRYLLMTGRIASEISKCVLIIRVNMVPSFFRLHGADNKFGGAGEMVVVGVAELHVHYHLIILSTFPFSAK